jgi:von Willebrand factor type A domain-containing protein
MKLNLKGSAAAIAIAGSLALLLTAGAGSAGAAVIPNCVAAQNVEGIIDDSGSMALNDSDRNRAGLMQTIAFFNPDKTMGAVEFGSDADNLFGPFQVGPSNGANFATILSSLNLIQADNGGTDYDTAFTLANAQNPNANARIFLSDGEPNFDPNPALWTNPKIPAYVVGFGSADFTVLNQIASDTGGPTPAFSITSQNDILNKAMIINARINCQTDPVIQTKSFARPGQTKVVSFKPSGNSAQVLLSWPDVGQVFKAFAFTQGKGGARKGVASAAKKGSHVRTTVNKGSNFIALNLTGLRSGKNVKFRLKAKKLSGGQSVSAAVVQ